MTITIDHNYLFQIPETTKFEFEDFVTNQLGISLTKPLTQEVCQYYLRNQCRMGSRCAYKHPSKTKLVVCKHWLRGLCKKGELCEFLHEYNLKKMPECWFFAKLGECTNPECQYLHIDPESKVKECPWYARGFCKHGADCRHKHTRAAACPNYVTGFCPNGANCTFGHPKFELPNMSDLPPIQGDNEMMQEQQQYQNQNRDRQHSGNYRSLNDITCYKCGENGHYANHCPKNQNHGM
ncbi:hypothetical protein BC833DRAFT_595140 [Globomyces pollinis-pini]|nr:hypothetical protein BC833DRAFT_595140 [Globomyces pollinis-pini]